MRGLQKSKRVSWPSDVNLCQVRLFLSEDSPSQVGQVGLGAQDHLQAKTSWLLHSNGMGSDDNLPPGFEGAHPANQLKNKLSQIPLITWRCPPKFVLNFTWQVVAGEESNEVEVQKQREMRVLEAVYPRPSAIPPNPSVSMDGEDMDNDDQKILLIPIVPVEDEEAALEMSADTVAPINIPMSSQSLLLPPGIPSASSSNAPNIPNPPANENVAAGMVPGVEPDVVAAASAAFTAVMRTNEQGNLIDHDLLIKILSNPKIIERIVTDHGVSSSNPQAVPNQRLPPIALSDQPPGHVSRAETNIPLSAGIPSGPFYSQSNGPGPVPAPRPPPSMVGPSSSSPPVRPLTKDVNYYKSLIQQHGEERQEPQDQSQSHSQFPNRPNHHVLGMNPETVVTHPKPRDSKPKIMKPCIYFHSSRGCRHGANCSYQHDASLQQRVSSMPEVQNAKRMKMDREITGT